MSISSSIDLPLWRGLGPFVALALVALFFTWGYLSMKQELIKRRPLEEIVITSVKLPELPVPYYLCRHLYPLITQHGQMMKCYREGV